MVTLTLHCFQQLFVQTVIRRGEKVPEGETGTPIVVCTRNDDLAGVVQATPENRRKGVCYQSSMQRWLVPEMANQFY